MDRSLIETAMELFHAAIERANPEQAVSRYLRETPLPPLAPEGRRFVVAVGKAAVPMMRAALAELPDAPAAALVVTNPENNTVVPGADVILGAHPVPDAQSAAAGQRVLALLRDTTAADQLLMLISGGGSALMVCPAPGLTLADKSAVNQLLLASGLDINSMNLVRQALSSLKGGGLLRAAAPAQVTSLLLSDVIGDDLRAIASGPTVAPLGTRADAARLLRDTGLWDKLPSAVAAHLSSPGDTAPPQQATNVLVGSNSHSLHAMRDRAETLGWPVALLCDDLTGDVAEACDRVVTAAQNAPTNAPVALLFGGETTVKLSGKGMGGRNQELALRVAQASAQLRGDWVFLSGGTDGRDGPTDAAGGIVTPRTWQSIEDAGQNPARLLANNDSYAALKAANALIQIGGTGTNVADVQVFLRRPLPTATP